MGGQSEQRTQTNQQSTTNPWAPTIGGLENIAGALSSQIPNATPTAAENEAFGKLMANAQAGNPYAPAIGGLAGNLLAGGGPDRGGILQGAYGNLQNQLTPWASGAMADPRNNPVLAQQLAVMTNDITDRINGQFAGAGRDLSPANSQALGRGILQGAVPLLANAQQLGVNAANTLFNAGASTASGLSSLDQARIGNQMAGAGLTPTALDATNWGPNQMLATEAGRRALPINNLQQIEQPLGILGALGGQSNAVGTSTTTPPQVPMWQQILGGVLAGAGTAARIASDARVKENSQEVGALHDGTPVYSFNYIGDETPRMGLMAQDVEQRRPDAVDDINGIKTVDYGKATEVAGILGKNFGERAMGGILSGKFPARTGAEAAPPSPAQMPEHVSALQRVLQGINENAATLMALGGGMIRGGVGRGFEAAAAASAIDDKRKAAADTHNVTLQSLLQAGVPPATAAAAARNPDVLKKIGGQAFGQAPETIKIRLAGGGETLLQWDPVGRQYVQAAVPGS